VHVPKENRNKLDNKEVKCILISYKDIMQGYEVCDSLLRKQMYSEYVVFREVKRNFKFEGVKKKKEPEKLVFELRNDEHDLDE
jgi:hypothetical protein